MPGFVEEDVCELGALFGAGGVVSVGEREHAAAIKRVRASPALTLVCMDSLLS
jgi:hypothetical protein